MGLTAVVPIKDRDAISVIQAKILGGSLAKGFQDALNSGPSSPFQPAKPRILSFSFAGQRIFYSTNMGFLGFPLGFGGFAPAWCATEHELIVAMTPQNIMAYLQHGPEHKSLATVPQVSRLIASADAPSMIEYVDTAKLFELLYPFVPLAALGGCIFRRRQTAAARRASLRPRRSAGTWCRARRPSAARSKGWSWSTGSPCREPDCSGAAGP